MDNSAISKDLWQTSNIITGFAVVQTLAFVYACSNMQFIDLINTYWCKVTIVLVILSMTIVQCHVVWWCKQKMISLYNYKFSQIDIDNKAIDTGMLVDIIKQAAIWRIVIMVMLLIPVLLCLYAPQLRGFPYNENKQSVSPSKR